MYLLQIVMQSDNSVKQNKITLEEDEIDLPTKLHGWGFPDTELRLNNRGQVELTGDRYLMSGKEFPNLRSWMEANASLNVAWTSPAQPFPKPSAPIKNQDFVDAISGHYDRLSYNNKERVMHAHGHTAQEVYAIKFGEFKRVPDAIVWPTCHKDVEVIVKAARDHNIVLIPYGGGTSVSHALIPPENERRMIVSVDMRLMNKVKWVNKANFQACFEAGALGRDIDEALAPHGLILGHEPDSIEFSTLGGWVSTRASGMRKNKYGNIEDIVQHIKIVTPEGVIQKSVSSPRISAGPDLHHIVLGSEGTLGIITEVVLRVRARPEVTRYGSIVFPNFELGVDCLTEVNIQNAAPVSIRLVDNAQFQFGQALKPGNDRIMEDIIDKIKKWYVLNCKKFDPSQMVAATLLFEGSASEVAEQEKRLYAIADKFGGMKGGEENGIRGYFLTYIIAYLRDFGFNYKFMAESFETTVPYTEIKNVCSRVKAKIAEVAQQCGVKHKPFVSSRVTQLYDTGAVIYFYFGFVWHGLEDPVAVYSNIEHEAREEILRNNGTISHHHGIGKLRSSFMEPTVGKSGMQLLQSIKNAVDPTNVFAVGNLGLTGNTTHAKL